MLSILPNRVVRKPYQAKKVDHESVAHRLAQTLAEVASAEQHKDYLVAVQEECKGELSLSSAPLDVLG